MATEIPVDPAQAAHPPSALDVWTRAVPAVRQPRFSRSDIAEAAVRIADAEGFEAVSMRRIAAELGAGTMTLYHYVRTKDELLALVLDAVMAEVVIPDDQPMPDDWRAAITLVAHRSLAAWRRHPWMADIHDDPALGPNSVRHFDQTMAAARLLGGDLQAQLDLALAVDEYVFGHCQMERNNFRQGADSSGPAGPIPPAAPTDDQAAMIAYVDRLLATGRYPCVADLSAEHGLASAWQRIHEHARDPERFDRNLQRLLDGFERGR